MSKAKLDTKIEYIAIKHLSVIWAQSQRPYNPKWAKEISEEFDPDKFDPLIVTKPNGEGVYHIIEGQHRRYALEMFAAKFDPKTACEEQAPCRVIADADPSRAAEIWIGINSGRKAIRPIDGFKVAVIANREPEVAINRMVIANGYHLSAHKSQDNISAVSALKQIYERHGKVTLNNVLKVIRMLWNGDPAGVSSPMLRGFGLFLHEFGTHVENKRMSVKIAAKWSPYKLLAAAKTRKQNSLERTDQAIAELLLREYNSGLRENLKLKRKG